MWQAAGYGWQYGMAGSKVWVWNAAGMGMGMGMGMAGMGMGMAGYGYGMQRVMVGNMVRQAARRGRC